MRNIKLFSRRRVGVRLHGWKMQRLIVWWIQATEKRTFFDECGLFLCFVCLKNHFFLVWCASVNFLKLKKNGQKFKDTWHEDDVKNKTIKTGTLIKMIFYTLIYTDSQSTALCNLETNLGEFTPCGLCALCWFK